MKKNHPEPHLAPNDDFRQERPSGEQRELHSRSLRRQNQIYAGTGGISEVNRKEGFVPGFFNPETGTAVVSRFANGTPAPIHLLDGLPDAWVSQRDRTGKALEACDGVVAGFLLGERFYTRGQAASLCAA